MEKPQSNLLFIDRNNYVSILDKKFNLDDLVETIAGKKMNERLSPLTTAIIYEINGKLHKAFFDSYFYNENRWSLFAQLSNTDVKYVEHYTKDSLVKSHDQTACIGIVGCNSEEKKYYELIPLSNNDILVVFEEAFFDITTESKDRLKEFVLDCLCHQYRFNSNLELLMKLYLSLQINDTYLDMVKLRFN